MCLTVTVYGQYQCCLCLLVYSVTSVFLRLYLSSYSFDCAVTAVKCDVCVGLQAVQVTASSAAKQCCILLLILLSCS
jgi:hypothetical protein